MNEFIEIKEGAALENAQQITDIVKNITEAMSDLNEIINKYIGGENSGKPVSTQWGETLERDWGKYYTADIPEIMNQMQQSAENLKIAVDKAITTSRS